MTAEDWRVLLYWVCLGLLLFAGYLILFRPRP